MVRANMQANINIISQKSEHMWQETLCVLSFGIWKPDIKHTNKTLRHITTHGRTHLKKTGLCKRSVHISAC